MPTLWSTYRQSYEAFHKVKNKPSAYERTTQVLNCYERIKKPVYLEAIQDDIEDFLIKRQEEGVANGSLNIDRGVLRAFFQRAVEKKIISENPCLYIRKFKIPKKSRRAFTREETEKLEASAKASPNRDDYDMFMAYLLTGMRLQELTHLIWDHVDLEKVTYKVEAWGSWSPKNCQLRENPTDERLQGIWERRYAERKEGERLVFPGPHGVYSRFTISHRFKWVCQVAGVKGTIHMLRHTFATRMAEAGCDPQTLMRLLGQSHVDMVMVYFTSELDHKRRQQNNYKYTDDTRFFRPVLYQLSYLGVRGLKWFVMKLEKFISNY